MNSIDTKGIDNARIVDSVMTVVIPKVNEIIEEVHRIRAEIGQMRAEMNAARPAVAPEQEEAIIEAAETLTGKDLDGKPPRKMK